MSIHRAIRLLQGTPGRNNSAEIMLALARYPDIPEAKRYAADRLCAIETGLTEHGIGLISPNIRHDDPKCSPVTATFRQASDSGYFGAFGG
jgi:hypothetical protein